MINIKILAAMITTNIDGSTGCLCILLKAAGHFTVRAFLLYVQYKSATYELAVLPFVYVVDVRPTPPLKKSIIFDRTYRSHLHSQNI